MNDEFTPAPHCVQCGEEMPYGLTIQLYHSKYSDLEDVEVKLQTCTNLECPNYGLLQLGREGMPDLLEDESEQ